MRNKTVIIILIVLGSGCLNVMIEPSVMKLLLRELIFNSVSILVGLSIAVVGICLSTINSVYLSMSKLIKPDKKEESSSNKEVLDMKSKLTDLVKELKENSLFSLIAFLVIIVLFFVKEINFSYLKWPISSKIFTKEFIFNTIILIANFLIFWSIIDSVKVVFKISEAFEFFEES